MADYKVTDLNEILSTSVASDDVALLVDVSAAEDKKIKVDELFKAGISLVGTGQINGDVITDNTLDGSKIVDGSITGGKLAPNSVDRTHVIAEEISGSQTTRGKIHIEPGSLGAADIANGSITADKLQGGVIPPGGITNNDISPNAGIEASKLEPIAPNTFLAGPDSGLVPSPPFARPLVSADLPIGNETQIGGISVPFGSGLSISGGVLTHTDTTVAQDLGYISYNDTGHILNARPIAGADLPIATASSLGVVSIGDGISVDVAGQVTLRPASTTAIGGVAIGSDFAVDFLGTISLAPTGVIAGEYPKVTVDANGRVTSGTTLTAADLPDINADNITSGTLDPARIADHSLIRKMLADNATCFIQEATPAIDSTLYVGTLWFKESTQDLSVWNGSSFRPIGFGQLSQQNLRYCGSVDASTGLITGVTAFGTSAGFNIGDTIPNATDALTGAYLVVDVAGSSVGVLPGVALSAGDLVLCNGATAGWEQVAALGGGGGGGGASKLNDLTDVTISGATQGQLLQLAPSNQWENVDAIAALPAGTANGQYLRWSNTNSAWEISAEIDGGSY